MAGDDTPLADASEAELAEVVADAREARGYQTTTKEQGSHLFVFAKRPTDDGGVRGAIVWIAARRSVGESPLRQLRSLAENVGASEVVCVTVGDGRVTEPAVADELGIDHVDGTDLRDDPDVDRPTSVVEAHSGAEPPPEAGVGPAVETASGVDSTPGADAGSGGDATSNGDSGTDRSDESSATARGDHRTGVTSTGSASGPGANATTAASGESREPGDRDDAGPSGAAATGGYWDGQTTAAAATAPFDDAWHAVTDGGSVDRFADLTVWDGTTRYAADGS